MKVVVQRVKSSSVKVENQIISQIGRGLNLLICMEKGDTNKSVDAAVKKIKNLRIFPDERGRMSHSVMDTGFEVLCISQFTLSWNGQKGNRPSFDGSMNPEDARRSFESFCSLLAQEIGEDKVKTGQFAASMEVSIINDGPVTFNLTF